MPRGGWRPSGCPTTCQHTWENWCRAAKFLLLCYRYNAWQRKEGWWHILYITVHKTRKTSFTHSKRRCRQCLFSFLQVEFHPQLCQTELRSVCEEYGVCFQAYSSLGKGELVTDPVVMEVAKNCERTPAQVNAHTKHLDNIFSGPASSACRSIKNHL